MSAQRGQRYPGLFISVDGKPIEVELPIPLHSIEGWQLYALLKSARRLHFLTSQCMPLLKAASLLEPNEHVEDLDELLGIIQRDASISQAQFLQRRTYQQSLLHDPKQLRQHPSKSLFS